MTLLEQSIASILTLLIWTARCYIDASGIQYELPCLCAGLWWMSTSFKLKFLSFPFMTYLHPSIRKWISDWTTNLNGISQRSEGGEDKAEQIWTPPLLYPSRTAHARLGSGSHSFSYSYLMVGVPVLGKDIIVNSMLAVDAADSIRAWYQVTSEDHLYRFSSTTDLRAQLDEFLKLQGTGTDPDLYPFAYLITAPRFLSYVFNPVSFWYLYSSEKKLNAMVLEVNNTFDERRMYLLQPKSSDAQAQTNGSVNSGEDEEPERLVFTETWAKDFHVSPFNDRKGHYSLEAKDPLQPECEKTPPAFRNIITLSTPDGDAKIVAKVFSVGTPLEPGNMTLLQRLKFVASWWWVGFVTFPRIVREAGKLFFFKGLQIWYRPEVNRGSIGRQSTKHEIIVERFFRSYLKHQVKECKDPKLSIRYINPTPSNSLFNTRREEIMISDQEPSENDVGHSPTRPSLVDFDVFTPFFYTHFVHYVHTIEAIIACTITARDENKLLHVSEQKILPILFPNRVSRIGASTTPQDRTPPKAKVPQSPSKVITATEDFEWRFLRFVRSQAPRPPAQAYPTTPDIASSDLKKIEDIRPQPLSDLDRFVYTNYGSRNRKIYREAVIKILESSQLGFNIFTFLKVIDWPIRLCLLWMAALSVRRVCLGEVSGSSELTIACLWANAVNIFALLRGVRRLFAVRSALGMAEKND